MAKVSIVIPVYNVQKYLRKCLESVVNQTLQDIEIICVDDGSTDSSGQILDEYASNDSRIKVIHKTNSGYGNSMNIGFENATGEYIGIIESDDYAELNMFETLYGIAHNNDLDVIKSSFYFYYSVPVEKNEKFEIVSNVISGVTMKPSTYFKSNMEMVELYNIKPSIWSAIYKRDFIRKNKIRFLETPGASFQDTSFNFKVWALAERAQLIQDAFLHYRQDGEGSSINSKAKIFCVCDEYEEMEKFLAGNPVLQGRLDYVLQRIKYDTYMWNLDRLSKKYKFIFLERASEEFKEAIKKGTMNMRYFESNKWEDMYKIASDPIEYYNKKIARGGKPSYWELKYKKIRNSLTYKIGSCFTILPRVTCRFIRCIFKYGIKYTFTVSLKELLGGKTFE